MNFDIQDWPALKPSQDKSASRGQAPSTSAVQAEGSLAGALLDVPAQIVPSPLQSRMLTTFWFTEDLSCQR